MANQGFEGVIEVNNFIQGFVDMIPGGRTIVDTFLKDDMDGGLADRSSVTYLAGEGGGMVWNILTLKGAGMKMVGSKIPYVAKLGSLITMNFGVAKQMDKARWCMEFSRCLMFSFRLYKNQERLGNGQITQQQFDAMREKDYKNYLVSGSVWAIPGTGGLWIAMANLIYGTVSNEAKLDIALQKK